MERTRNMKFTHTVDYDTIKIISEGNFTYIIIAMKTNLKIIFNKFYKYVFQF